MLNTFNEVLTGTERVLDTPPPAAYNIAISQISWIYVMLLPFQLYRFLLWTTIPASMGKCAGVIVPNYERNIANMAVPVVAAYIIIGLLTIGSEIENPFGHDVNDLPLTMYCRQIAQELDIITATPPPDVGDFMPRSENLVLFPLSQDGYPMWKERSKEDIRAALRAKVKAGSSKNHALDGSDTSTMNSPRTPVESV